MNGVNVMEGSMDASGLRFAVVVARFNSFITERLLEGAIDALVRSGANAADITVMRVPGAWELPLVAHRAAASANYDAVVALGCLMRGDTLHFELIAGEAAKGLSQAARETGIPISFGVLTTDTLEQAVNRAGAKSGNKGSEAAMAAVEQVRLLQVLDGGGRKQSRSKRP